MPVSRTDYHVFRVAPQCEAFVCRKLAKRHIWALSPRTEAFVQGRAGKSRSRIWASQPVFPGYVFASIANRQWGTLRLVPYLHPQPLAMDGTPYRLTETDLATIRRLQFSPLADPRAPVAPHVFKSGELVRILQGPFAAFMATVEADKGRELRVSARIFGRPTPVTVRKDWVEAA